MTTIEDFQRHLQDLHETSRTMITLQSSNESDVSLIDKITGELSNFEDELSIFEENPIDRPPSNPRIRDAFLFLKGVCEERR